MVSSKELQMTVQIDRNGIVWRNINEELELIADIHR